MRRIELLPTRLGDHGSFNASEMTGHERLVRPQVSDEQTQILSGAGHRRTFGDGDTESVVKCLEAGAEDHLTKPFEPVVLQARIRASLERKRMRDLEMAYLRRVAQLASAAEAVERQTYDSQILASLVTEGDQLG